MPSQESHDGADADPVRAVSARPPEGARKKKKRAKPPLPRTEREIDAPDRLTLLLLAVMGFMTIVLWAFAKGGCNYHPPRETRRPRAVKTEELARDPKDAALEMQQRFVQYDFDGALELAADSAETDVKRKKAECATKVKECAETKKKNERAATVAVLLERDMASATVRATTTGAGAKQANIVRLERKGPLWKVVSLAADDGSYTPKPRLPVEITPGSGPMIMEPPAAGASAVPKRVPAPGASAPKPVVTRPAPPASAKP